MTDSTSSSPERGAVVAGSGVRDRRRLTPVRLTELAAGARGELHTADLEMGDRQMLYALGFGERCAFRLLKTGNPWIVQIRTTRIGLSEAIARGLLVIPEGELGDEADG